MTGRLRRELGLGGAVVTGLGSILGTGAFVAIGVAAGMWGGVVVYAIPVAGLVAVFNGLSSAFLAGRFPVAGGTYEYAYQVLNPWLGFSAGWLFLLAKTASAATAALGVALYLGAETPLVPIGAVLLLTALVLAGLRRTTVVNTLLVGISATAIVWFSAVGLSRGAGLGGYGALSVDSLPAAAAFLFVAYTGYGRIATLGEEVRSPERTIPKAVVVTLAAAAALYLAIQVGGHSLGGDVWGQTIAIADVGLPVVTLGAITAMVGVLLNLVLGLSRVWLAMGRRGDMPAGLGRLDERAQPRWAIVVSGVAAAVVTLIGDISVAWSFSAMTVLLYYGITNLAAIRIQPGRWTAWAGMGSCVFLSFYVPVEVWLVGAGLITLGLAGKVWKTRLRPLG